MSVKEVAGALSVSEQTIRYWVRKLYPEITANGIQTRLGEREVTAIKGMIGSGRNDLPNIHAVNSITTDLEMLQKTQEVIQFLAAKTKQLQEKIAEMTPGYEAAKRISDSEGLHTISEVGKINGIGPRSIFTLLESRLVIFRERGEWVPYQDFINRGYFVVKTGTYQIDGIDHLRKQTYVTGKGELWMAKILFRSPCAPDKGMIDSSCSLSLHDEPQAGR